MQEAIKNILRRGRWLARSAVGKDVFHRPQTKRPVTFFGGRPDTGFGAWAVFAEPLTPESVVYSVGVGDDISFDLDLIGRLGVTVHAFDPTPASHAWLARQQVPEAFRLHAYALGGRDGTTDFYAHENPEWVSHSVLKTAHTVSEAITVPVRRVQTLMQMLGHDHVDLLKLDIEGAEYDVIDDLAASEVEVRQLLVEFHHRFEGLRPDMTQQAIRKLNARGFRSFHVSPNGEEYAFVRA